MKNILKVKDGDTISIIATVGPSVYDPAATIEAVAQSYRVVANFNGQPVLALVPLKDIPVALSAGIPLDGCCEYQIYDKTLSQK